MALRNAVGGVYNRKQYLFVLMMYSDKSNSEV